MTYVLTNPRAYAQRAARETTLTPAVDIVESIDKYTISIDLPGFRKDGFKVVVNEGVLTVSGDRGRDEIENDDFYRYYERPVGTYYRAFKIPEDVVDGTDVKAEYVNGVLNLELKKREKALPRTINVQ